jgi:hypothetical protein
MATKIAFKSAPGVFQASRMVRNATLNHVDHSLPVEQCIRGAICDFINGSHGKNWQFFGGQVNSSWNPSIVPGTAIADRLQVV